MVTFQQAEGFPGLCFRFGTDEARWVTVTRATYDLGDDGSLTPRVEQPPLNFCELAYGDVVVTPPRRESDIAPEKPKVDLVVQGTAFAPGGRPAPRFEVGLSVADPGGGALLDRRLVVTGPRAWRRGARGGDRWSLGEPDPTCEVPLRFDRAYGGIAIIEVPANGSPARSEHLAHVDNPVGRGFIPSREEVARACRVGVEEADRLLTRWLEAHPTLEAPQIELPGKPLGSPMDRYPLAGWGLVAKHWRLRHQHVGTMDQAWMESRMPRMPLDFDARYWCGAHPDLQLERLPAGSTVTLRGLTAADRDPRQTLRIELPAVEPVLRFGDRAVGEIVEAPLKLDTVLIDLDAREVVLLHRAQVTHTPSLDFIHLYPRGAA